MPPEIILTEDGSHSLLQGELNETYHSVHGAIQESAHIFIEAGMKQCTKNQLQIFEVGFGTGLNAFLTLLESESTKQKITYTAIELYPLSNESACLLNYPDLLSPDKKDLYFSSNRFGGFGGKDIWVTHRQPNGKWSKPENLGSTINTSADETCPFIHADNQTLFF